MSEFGGLWKDKNNQRAFVPPKTECGCPSGGGIENGHIRYPLLWRNAERNLMTLDITESRGFQLFESSNFVFSCIRKAGGEGGKDRPPKKRKKGRSRPRRKTSDAKRKKRVHCELMKYIIPCVSHPTESVPQTLHKSNKWSQIKKPPWGLNMKAFYLDKTKLCAHF